MMNFDKLKTVEDNAYLTVMDDKIKNINRAIEGLETINEAISINANIHHFNKLIYKIDPNIYINFYSNFGNDFSYLVSLKDFEKLYEKQKTQDLSDNEKRAYDIALDNLAVFCYPIFKTKEEITPNAIREVDHKQNLKLFQFLI